ncbi:MAG: hypothetical protein KIT36_03030 [Alphaproteobacteria bacterium]|nr:hypothetical protein [Alphaproteobacteria bacterium]
MSHTPCGGPESRQDRLTLGLMALLMVSAALLAWLGGEAQSCALYGAAHRPPHVGLFDVATPLSGSVSCLADHGRARDVLTTILPLLVDDLFAISYGGGIGLLVGGWGTAAARQAWPRWSVRTLHLAGWSYAIGGAFDLIENQSVIATLLIGDRPATDLLLIIARAAAAPKYGLALLVAPALLLVGGLLGFIATLRRL